MPRQNVARKTTGRKRRFFLNKNDKYLFIKTAFLKAVKK